MNLAANLVFLLVGVAIGAALGDLTRQWLTDHRWGDNATSTALGLAILAAVGYGALSTAHRNQGFECALQARADATARANTAAVALDAATRRFLTTIAGPATAAARESAFTAYYRALDEHTAALQQADQVRADNPLGGGQCP